MKEWIGTCKNSFNCPKFINSYISVKTYFCQKLRVLLLSYWSMKANEIYWINSSYNRVCNRIGSLKDISKVMFLAHTIFWKIEARILEEREPLIYHFSYIWQVLCWQLKFFTLQERHLVYMKFAFHRSSTFTRGIYRKMNFYINSSPSFKVHFDHFTYIFVVFSFRISKLLLLFWFAK